MEMQKHKKTGGMGLHGGKYQIKLLCLFLLEAFKKEEEFRLSTEKQDGGKFDDVVLQTDNETIFLQAKHKKDPKDKKSFITYEDIVNSKKDEFYLYKYLKCVPDIQKKFNNITALILCTNTTFTKDKKDMIRTYICTEEMEEDHIFYFSDKKFYYTFNDNCKDIMPSDKNPAITEDVFELFLEKMQLISIDDTNIDRRIESLIKEIDIFDAARDTRHAVMALKEYIENWVEDKNGTYIIPQHLGVFRSQHFLNELKQLDVEFNAAQQEIATLSKYNCFTIENEGTAKLHLIKIYKQLKTEKILIVDYNDTISRKKEIISAFIIDKFVYLLIPLFKSDYDHLKTAINDIAIKTFERNYKKIIFIVESVEMSQELSKDLKHAVDVQKNIITLETFSENYQNELCSRVIRFQEKDVQLKDIVPVSVLNTILDETMLLNLIYKKQIIINERYQESTINFYIPRSLYSISPKSNSTEENGSAGNSSKTDSEESEILSEEDFCNIVCNENTRKTILLTDGPGTGKTSIVSNLQKMINSKFNFWIMKINLNDYTATFKKHKAESSAKLFSLLAFDQTSKLNNFEKSLFNLPGRVILILDAFDEIHQIYSDLILKLIQYCAELDNVRRVIITSRPHCISFIRNAAKDSVVYSLKPISKESQITYLSQYWTAKLTPPEDNLSKCNIFAETLIDKFNLSIIESASILEVPLHCQMLAEIFESSCQTYLVAENFEAEFTKKINIASLYDMFIEKKRDIYVDEKCNIKGNAQAEVIIKREFAQAIDELTIKALLLIFDDAQCQHFKILQRQNMKEIELNSLLMIGFLKESNGVVNFINHTFAEYLVAKHICDFLLMDKNFYTFFWTDVCGRVGNYHILLFINSILEVSPVSEEILINVQEITEIFEKECKCYMYKYFKGLIKSMTTINRNDTFKIPKRNTSKTIFVHSELKGILSDFVLLPVEGFKKMLKDFLKLRPDKFETLFVLDFKETNNILRKFDGPGEFISHSFVEFLVATVMNNLVWSVNRLTSLHNVLPSVIDEKERLVTGFLIYFWELYRTRWYHRLTSFLRKSANEKGIYAEYFKKEPYGLVHLPFESQQLFQLYKLKEKVTITLEANRRKMKQSSKQRNI